MGVIDKVIVAAQAKFDIKEQRKYTVKILLYFIVFIIISIFLSIFVLKSEHKLVLTILLIILLIVTCFVLYLSDQQYKSLLESSDEIILGKAESNIFGSLVSLITGDISDSTPQNPCIAC